MNETESVSTSSDQRLGRCRRLREPSEFRAVYNSGLRVSGRCLAIHWLARPDRRSSRLGVSVGRKHGNAVIRALWKRLFREAFRRNRHLLTGAFDLVFIPRGASKSVRSGRKPNEKRASNPPPSLAVIEDDVRNAMAHIGRSGG